MDEKSLFEIVHQTDLQGFNAIIPSLTVINVKNAINHDV